MDTFHADHNKFRLLAEAEMREGIVNGVAVWSGDANHDLVVESLGRAGPAADAPPMTPDTLIDIASVTKVLVPTTALLILRDRGLVDFDHPFTEYLPEFSAPLPAPVTVRDLACHVSGFGHEPGEKHRIYAAPTDDGPALLRNVLRFPPLRPPGEKVEYTCWNFLLLSLLVERVTGETLPAFADREIFRPLGMADTSLGRPVTDDPARLAETYASGGPGKISDFVAVRIYRDGGYTGNAGAFSSARDLARFARCLLRRGALETGGRLFSEDSFAAVLDNRSPDPVIKRGFGWVLSDAYKPASASRETIYHTGWSGQTVFIDYGLGRFVVVLTTRNENYERAKEGRARMIDSLLRSCPLPRFDHKIGVFITELASLNRFRQGPPIRPATVTKGYGRENEAGPLTAAGATERSRRRSAVASDAVRALWTSRRIHIVGVAPRRMPMTLPRYYASEDEFQRLRPTLKLHACPHCRKTGTLNLHGYLRGYSEQGGNTLVTRGHRLFCNNRRRRPGCGKTVGLRLCHFLHGFILTLHALWIFLVGTLDGHTKADAFRQAATALHPTTADRVFRRVERAQSRLRARLDRLCPPPPSPDIRSPLAATLAHLRAAFPHARCPPAEYQARFQCPFPV